MQYATQLEPEPTLAPDARIVAHLAYPTLVAGALALYTVLLQIGVSPQWSAYVAGTVGVLCILALERAYPYRAAWRPDASELATDVQYWAAVQVALPMALGFGVTALLIRTGRSAELWPSSWPLAAQFVLLLASADALRYALHRAAHQHAALWRWHAVHHAPHKLYAFNVNRFHPVERTLQYALETLPFALLGASESVLGLYVVFHVVHGFFQHANVAVRLGVLNYLVSGPELHRWHHSREALESNANYANHLSVWDWLFGTYKLPRAREVGALGLRNERYPARFSEQLRAPFVVALDAEPTPLPGWADLASCALLRLRLRLLHAQTFVPLVAAARRPRQAQLELLRRILRANRDTRFGREHGFAALESYEAFRSAVPVQSYESLRPYIEAQEASGESHLLAERPVVYALTSGTTAAPKYLPLSRRALAEHREGQHLAAYLQYRAQPRAYDGKLLVFVGAAIEGRLPSGTPYGSISGYLYRGMPRLARRRYVLPPEVFEIEDCELKYLTVMRLALAEPRITAFGAANPSTFLKLCDVVRRYGAELARDLERQSFARLADLAPEVRSAVVDRLRCTPARAAQVRALIEAGAPRLADLWPELRLVATWTGGSCGSALARLRGELPAATRIVELGYLASELRGSFTIDPARADGVPNLCHDFFEFVEKERWEREDPEFLLLDQLEPGREYYVFVTTSAGLYRYHMNDIVRAVGRFESTPTIEFVQKGKGVTSITGEKLYEGQLLDALRQLEREAGVALRFFVMLADVEGARYRLLLEADVVGARAAALGARLDALLGERNLEYRAKRASGRLGAIEVLSMRSGFSEAYKAWCVAQGQREGQFKALALQYAADFGMDHAPHVERESA
jgi:sterol desaturase/sphingolipid hydroxylase (fatty acid hydroxylase superfamily)